MFDVFFEHILNKVTLTGAEKISIQQFFTPRNLLKKQFLVQEGEYCKYFAFLSKGLMRSYSVDDKGIEHMNFFAVEGWWITDMYGFSTGQKAIFNVDAIEDSELLLISKEHFETMLLQIPVMDRYFRMLFQNSILSKEFRLVSHTSHTAEEKYQHFVKNNPHLVNRIPQTMIASYLGITPETLSRIKKRLIQIK